MESVAKSVQGPIKILFVAAWADPTADPPTKLITSLLGLGDIVVPGERRERLRTFFEAQPCACTYTLLVVPSGSQLTCTYVCRI